MILKAEYLFRPRQLFRRLFYARTPVNESPVEARLPWGRSIKVSLHDNIGPAVLTLGVYDLVVTETLWRLTDAMDVTLDVGANIGCMTAVLAERSAVVHCFEPHPVLSVELGANVQRLSQQGVPGTIHVHEVALGESAGILPLKLPKDFARHRGEASLAADVASESTIPVPVSTLDSLFAPPSTVGVMKLDVEGFERQVLSGGQSLLADQRLRDCVFEEHHAYPSEVTTTFESNGYTVFRLARGLTRPRLLKADSSEPRSRWEATSFLATCEPDRAMRLLAKRGWLSLGAARR